MVIYFFSRDKPLPPVLHGVQTQKSPSRGGAGGGGNRKPAQPFRSLPIGGDLFCGIRPYRAPHVIAYPLLARISLRSSGVTSRICDLGGDFFTRLALAQPA